MPRTPEIADTSPATTPLLFAPLPQFRAAGLLDDAERADCRGKRIGVLVVAYNALTTLSKVLSRITPNVWANVEEIAVFDDASQDATYELAVGLKVLRELPKLSVLKHEHNLGYGGNQKAGYRYFQEKGFDIVVLLHGDGQYAPEILSYLYDPLITGEADAVFGSRMMNDYGGPLKGGMPLYKYVGNRILTVYENRALKLNLTEFHSGYRAYNLHALSQIQLDRMTDNFHFDTEIIIKLQHQNFIIKEVPIPTYYGTEICYVNGMRYARDVFRAVERYKQTIQSVERYPEFEEYFIHYPIKTSRHSSHHYARRLSGSGNAILDVGCGRGFFATQLVENGNTVTGVDAIPATEVLPALKQYHQQDLDGGLARLRTELTNQFDCVLLLDVIEHLRNPELILEQCREFLRPNGKIILSVPNVANITVRLALLLGRFEYRERGILDRTHLHFFTRRSIRRFVEGLGFNVQTELLTVMPLELAFGWNPDRLFARLVNRLLAAATRLLPGLLGYQIMLVLKPTRTTPSR